MGAPRAPSCPASRSSRASTLIETSSVQADHPALLGQFAATERLVAGRFRQRLTRLWRDPEPRGEARLGSTLPSGAGPVLGPKLVPANR